jgi:hypothetical protein
MSEPRNRLAASSSPYLLQHAGNPVDWYPWSPEALERARREDKPILLSIGYAACHWCHVMERESFEDAKIAQLMNERFVCIKVDREERPDLDQIYQLVVQLMGRSGGWPLTVFLTPEQQPFFAGTYFPPTERHGMPGFPRVLDALAEAYRERRSEVAEQAEEITTAIARATRTPGPEEGRAAIDVEALRRASRKLLGRFDDRHGGFGQRPKFPNTMGLDVLLRRGVLEDDRVARESVERALDGMRAGGIWDHLRGGFHRYSTDERWLVPHFEKMLYDNALLLRLYVDGYRVFDKPRYAETAREIVGYLLAEMRDGEGAFFASQDADSEGHEGRFFVFTPADLHAAVGADERVFEVARAYFGVTEEGNFEESGATVLAEARAIDRVAAALDLPLVEAEAALAEAKRRMLAFRERRPRPSRDDKVLASWNGLLLGALAEAGRALAEPAWVTIAEEAFASLSRGLLGDGRVGRYLKGGVAAEAPGFLDDHAYLGNAALDLYEATGAPRYVDAALSIGRRMVEQHLDAKDGGFFFAPSDGEPLIARTKDAFDQAVPSAASMAALLCMRLGALADASFAAHGERQIELFAADAAQNPLGMGQAVLGVDRVARGSTDVVVVGRRADAEPLVAAIYRHYVPDRNVAWIDPDDAASLAAARVAGADKPVIAGKVVAYVCRGRACSAPVSDPAKLGKLLQGATRPA